MSPPAVDDGTLVTIEDMTGIDIPDLWQRMAAARSRGEVVGGMPFADTPLPGIYSALSFTAVTEVLRDERTFSSRLYDTTIAATMGRTILSMQGDEHDAHRALASAAFRQKALARWEDELVRPVVDELLDAIAPSGQTGRADLVRTLTFQFPVRVIARILGLPRDDFARFQRWSMELIAGAGMAGVEASRALRDYFLGIIEQRRAEPSDDLISDLVQGEVDGRPLTDDELVSFLRLLLPAGVETTFRATSNLLLLLLTHRDQLEAVTADRSLVGPAIEETLRFEPPLLLIARTAEADAEVAGTPIAAGSQVMVWLGAANRDPDRWERPDEFDITRPARPHAAFGGGPHLCLGLHLARLEARVATVAVLDRLGGLRLDEEQPVPRIRGNLFRSPATLPVAFEAA